MEAWDASRQICDLLARAAGGGPRVRAWDGREWGPADAPATLVLQHPGALAAVLLPPTDLAAGEAYVFDDIDIEGDVVDLLGFGERVANVGALDRLRVLRLARKLPKERRRHATLRPTLTGRLHSPRRDRTAVSHHYDTGNDFFALFLDSQMVYSCGHFLHPEESLETAQQRKLDLICRKLGLARGQRFLDVGCGWGALLIHAATEYGVEATGVTASAEQAEEARKRAADAGVAERVTVVHDDYRSVRGTFDAIASVGMVEHVGVARLPQYYSHLRSLLSPGGRFLNHSIFTRARRLPRGRSFVRTYVFPDGQLHRLEDSISAAEDAGLEVRDVELLRQSYALTLRHWVRNLERRAAEARQLVGDQTYRIWRLYMAGSVVAFERAHITVGQMLLTRPAGQWRFGRSSFLAADDRPADGSV